MTPTASILLADESPFFLNLQKQFLKNTPAHILEAHSGSEALEVCRQHRPDLVYLGFDLQDMDAPQFLQRLPREEDRPAIPVIVVCDPDSPGQLERSRQAGCVGVLTKPIEKKQFLSQGRCHLAAIREHRRPCLLPVCCRWKDGEIYAKGLDISSGGIFLETRETITPGEPVDMEIQLKGAGHQGAKISCSGHVAWLNTREKPIKEHHPVGLGIKFDLLSATTTLLLTNFLSGISTGGD